MTRASRQPATHPPVHLSLPMSLGGSCSQTDRLCLESNFVKAGEPTIVWYPKNQLPPSFTSLDKQLTLVQGRTTGVDPCQANIAPIQKWNFNLPSVETPGSFVAGLNITIDTTDSLRQAVASNNHFYLVMNVPNRCLSGPYSVNGDSVILTLAPPVLSTAGRSTAPGNSPIVVTSGVPQPITAQPASQDHSLSVGLVAGLACGIVVLAIALVAAIWQIRTKNQKVSSGKSNTSVSNVDVEQPRSHFEVVSDSESDKDTRPSPVQEPKTITVPEVSALSSLWISSEDALMLASTFRSELLEPADGWDASPPRSSGSIEA